MGPLSDIFNPMNHLDAKNVKSPFSILNELSLQTHIQLKHDIKAIYSSNNGPPTFMSIIQFGKYTATFSAPSKQKAKHGAVLSIIDKIKADTNEFNPTIVQMINQINQYLSVHSFFPVLSNETAAAAAVADDKTDSHCGMQSPNAISDIGYLCQKFNLKFPEFTYDQPQGPPHKPTFICNMEFCKFKEQGIGLSKQAAKHQAAMKMLENLKNDASFNTVLSKTESIKQIKSANDFSSVKSINKINTQIRIPIPSDSISSSSSINTNDDKKKYSTISEIRNPLKKLDLNNNNNNNSSIKINGSNLNLTSSQKMSKQEFDRKIMTSSPIIPNQNGLLSPIVSPSLLKHDISFKTDNHKIHDATDDDSFARFRNSNKPFIKDLLNKEFNFNKNINYVRKLEILSREQDFYPSYREIKWQDPQLPGATHVFVSLSTNPVYVFCGFGNGLEAAKQHAAFCALYGMKLICEEK